MTYAVTVQRTRYRSLRIGDDLWKKKTEKKKCGCLGLWKIPLQRHCGSVRVAIRTTIKPPLISGRYYVTRNNNGGEGRKRDHLLPTPSSALLRFAARYVMIFRCLHCNRGNRITTVPTL